MRGFLLVLAGVVVCFLIYQVAYCSGFCSGLLVDREEFRPTVRVIDADTSPGRAKPGPRAEEPGPKGNGVTEKVGTTVKNPG